LHIWPLGTPGLTDLSTNASCQLEKMENLAPKNPSVSTYTVGQGFAPRSEENRENRNACQMFGITVRFRGDAMLSTKVPCKFEVKVVAHQERSFATFSLRFPESGAESDFPVSPPIDDRKERCRGRLKRQLKRKAAWWPFRSLLCLPGCHANGEQY